MSFKISSFSLLKITLFSIPLLIFFWLAWQYFSFSGNLSIEYDFQGESPFISEFRPRGRALDREKNLRTGEVYQKIVGDPVYMDVTVPRSFDSVDVTVEYNNPDQPFVELGIIANTNPWNVQLFPFESKVIDEAIATWHRIDDTERHLSLLQRNQQFDSVTSFVSDRKSVV